MIIIAKNGRLSRRLNKKRVENASFLLTEARIRDTLVSVENKGWEQPEQIKSLRAV